MKGISFRGCPFSLRPSQQYLVTRTSEYDSPSVYERADEGLLKLLKKAESAALSDEEIDLYEACMKKLEDEIDMKEYGFEIGMAKGLAEGKEKGLAEGRVKGKTEAIHQTVRAMKKNGLSIDLIANITGLTPTEIKSI